MCLGIPMQLMTIDGVNGRGHAAGIERDINLFLLQHESLQCGDFVMVHVGYAIQKIEPQLARSAWELHDQMTRG